MVKLASSDLVSAVLVQTGKVMGWNRFSSWGSVRMAR